MQLPVIALIETQSAMMCLYIAVVLHGTHPLAPPRQLLVPPPDLHPLLKYNDVNVAVIIYKI